MSTALSIIPETKYEKIEKLKVSIETLKLELMQLECHFKIGEPLYIFDKWNRVGTLKGFQIFNGQAAIVLQLYTKDKTPYDYFCYDVHKLKELKVK